MARTIVVRISIGNPAFAPARGNEVARILRRLADQYETDGLYFYETLRDDNGNIVGIADLAEEGKG